MECAAWESQGTGAQQCGCSSWDQRESQAGEKATVRPRALGGVKVTESSDGTEINKKEPEREEQDAASSGCRESAVEFSWA